MNRMIIEIPEEEVCFRCDLERLLFTQKTVSFRYLTVEEDKAKEETQKTDADKPKNQAERYHLRLCALGMSPHLKGVSYLAEAAAMQSGGMEERPALTKEVYPKIARKYNTSAASVERAIRHAIGCFRADCLKKSEHPGKILFTEAGSSNAVFLSACHLYLSKE